MPINPETLVMMAREQLTELPESVVFSRENLIALIKPAIALWQEQTNSDPARRHPFIVSSDDIAIESGVADLTNAIIQYGFRTDFIKDSDIIIPAGKVPNFTVKFVPSLDRMMLSGRQDKFFVLAYLSGQQITFRAAGEKTLNTMNGVFILRSVVIPSSLALLPASFAPELSTVIATLARKELSQQNRGLDMPPK